MRAFPSGTTVSALVALGGLVMGFTAAAQRLDPPFPSTAPVVPPPPRPLPVLVPPAARPGPFPIVPIAPHGHPATVSPTATPMVQPAAPGNYNPLTAFAWDAEQKELTPNSGETHGNFTFWFTNTSPAEVVINAVRTSCGCTVARLPATPWPIAPGTNGPIEVALDLRGKMGTIAKSVTVETTAGIKSLIVKVNIPAPGQPLAGGPAPASLPPGHPPMADTDRLANMQKALADRQVVFKDAACAKCHADPAKNVADGHAIYRGVCATCHDSPQRAQVVTNLKALKHETDLDYWKHWIIHGKPGSMMPSFAQSAGEGGPLTDSQVTALATYCMQTFQPPRALTVPGAPIKPTNATVTAINILPAPSKVN